MRIKKKEQSVGILGKITNLFSNSKQDAYSCDYVNRLNAWKEAIVDDNTINVPISWDNLKEISFRVLGTDSATFSYVTIPKEQWSSEGAYEVGVPCFSKEGAHVGYKRFWVSQKNTNNFVITYDGTANAVSVYYK